LVIEITTTSHSKSAMGDWTYASRYWLLEFTWAGCPELSVQLDDYGIRNTDARSTKFLDEVPPFTFSFSRKDAGSYWEGYVPMKLEV
jgi:hypothetical protein